VARNVDEAAHWYRIAADRGDPIAQTNLAYLYENGQMVSGICQSRKVGTCELQCQGFARADSSRRCIFREAE